MGKVRKVKQEKGVQCDVCNKVLRSKYNLKIHLAVHTGEKRHVCKVCRKGFQQKWNLVTHTARVHLKQKPFTCKDCGKAFGYSSHFKKHVMKMHYLNKASAPESVKKLILNPHKCGICPRSFENNYRLQEHRKKHTASPFRCDMCTQSFPLDHMLRVHKAQRHFEFGCHVCGVVCSSHQQLANHYTTAHEEKDYTERRKELLTCEMCGKQITRDSMKKHLNIHTRQRVYHCRFCSKPFLESGQRNTHERTHTGEKPYLCDVCGKGHAQHGNLMAHRKKHHNLVDKVPRPRRTKLRYEPLETPQVVCTGEETLEEFRRIADLWFSKRFRKSEENSESEDDIPLAALIQSEGRGKAMVVNEKAVQTIDETIMEQVIEYVNTEKEISNATICNIENVNIDTTEEINIEEIGVLEEVHSDIEVDDVTQKPKPDPNKEKADFNTIRNDMIWLIFDKIYQDSAVKDYVKELDTIRKLCLKRKKKSKCNVLSLLMSRLGKTLPDNAVLRRQVDGTLLWLCWSCGAEFKSRHRLIRHLMIHQPEDTWPFRCDTCGKSFTQSNNYKEHVLSHTQECLYYCETCGRGFRHKTHFNKHIETHDPSSKPTTDKKYGCEFCAKAFDTVFHKKEHERVHTKEKPYLCKTCGDQFGACSTYNRHQRTHTHDRPFQCPVCLNLFKEKSSLRRHKQTHLGVKKFSCDCGRLFSHKQSLKKHKYVCENSANKLFEKPHQCLQCGKRFLTGHDLKRHVDTHDPEKHYTCDICNAKLKSRTTFRRHVGLHVLHNTIGGAQRRPLGQKTNEIDNTETNLTENNIGEQ